ncbi:MAG: hypothetical protein LH613_07890 [Chamaesiphon sp.]|nr:hypothetical protein [Chamaesiphon sp.]
MISSEELHQQLQAGQIQAALALIVRDASELDVTTRMTEDLADCQSSSSEYLRTKINLLTGEIHNEVGKDVVTRNSYIKLQQLHIDQIIVSHRLVQGYLDRVKAILTVLDSSQGGTADVRCSKGKATPMNDRLGKKLPQPSILPHSGNVNGSELNSNDLVARLTQSAMLVNITALEQFELATAAEVRSIDLNLDRIPNSSCIEVEAAAGEHPQPQPAIVAPLASPVDAQTDRVLVDPLAVDDDIDLSIDEDGSVWEEWVEDEDFMPSSVMSQPRSASPPLNLPDRHKHWERRHLNPIAVKPIAPRTTDSAVAAPQWDRFVPEYIGVSSDSPPLGSNGDAHQIERSIPLDT